MALTAAARRTFLQSLNGGLTIAMPLGATEVVFAGSAVSSDAGFASPLAAGENFQGFALEDKTGGASDADVTVDVQTGGYAKLAVTSVAQADIGKVAYASDDGTFTLVGTSNSSIGRVVHVPATGTAWVALKAIGETLHHTVQAGKIA